jgi:1,4-alpha-glucan branching enzyme
MPSEKPKRSMSKQKCQFNSDVSENWVNPDVIGNGGRTSADPHPMHDFAFSTELVLPANSLLIFTR